MPKIPLSPTNILKPYLKFRPLKSEVKKFEMTLERYLQEIDESHWGEKSESEENQKKPLSRLLENSLYKDYHLNTYDKIDLVIHLENTRKSDIGVIFEAKRPINKSEMITLDNFDKKAFQELLLYYFKQRVSEKNLRLKHLIITNFYEFYIFDAQEFEKVFYSDKELLKQFNYFSEKTLISPNNDLFYKEIASPAIQKAQESINFCYFNLKTYQKYLKPHSEDVDPRITSLYKIFSPKFLLKQQIGNDSNSLDKAFYNELLHIMGLEEVKENGKKIITRKSQKEYGSLLENTIEVLKSSDKLSRLSSPSKYGQTEDKILFNVALELVITWINRILFLKLLEGQLINYNKSNDFAFLNEKKLSDYDDLYSLFFSVLALKEDDRRADFAQKFGFVPYLNSSLFEHTELEQETFSISGLSNKEEIKILSNTVLKDHLGHKLVGKKSGLGYLLSFLDSYDFGSDANSGDLRETNKTIINASVLGLIFEKINGYKDGSFFTPGFITMYMAKETIQKAIIQKFNHKYSLEIKDFDELKNFVGSPYQKEKLIEYNQLVDSLKIVDPAVGSGHFLVSCLNQIIVIKSDLNILVDSENTKISGYEISILNDELIIQDANGELFSYNPANKESQRIQQTLFSEKQKIIENCLFGVDINPNSVKICQLRLWIELLKNAYYLDDIKTNNAQFRPLQTLPNIDINIKCGNSLISRYTLDTPIGEILKTKKWTIDSYKLAISAYHNAANKQQKREFEKLINEIKQDFKKEISSGDKRFSNLKKYTDELFDSQTELFELDKINQKEKQKRQDFLKKEISKLKAEIEDIQNNKIYENAFEWRFEFPEVLDEEGKFVGFDVVIGNPPYIGINKFIKNEKDYFKNHFTQTFEATGDIYGLFYEQGWSLLKTDGALSYITSNKWMRAGYGERIRDFFVKKTNPKILLDLGSGIFDNATVDSNILIFTKAQNQGQTKALKVDQEYFNKLDQELKIINFNSSSGWFLGNNAEFNLKHKIEINGKPLKDWDVKINYGIKTGLNEAFIIDEEKKNELIAQDPKSAEIIKPILRGRDIKRYGYEFAGLYLINSHNGYMENSPSFEGVAGRSPDGVVLVTTSQVSRNTQNYMNLPYNSKLKQNAQELRKAGNLSEVILWNKVKNNQLLGLDFDRQKIIGNYIVDFYSPNLGLVVEIDGESHDFKGEYDQQRENYLQGLGLKIIHFEDVRIKKDLNNVINELYNYCNSLLLKTTPSTLRVATPSTEGEFLESQAVLTKKAFQVPPININNYPAIKEHLDTFEPALSKRQDKGNTQYNLRNCAYVDEFEKEKVVWQEMSKDSCFSYDVNGIFCNDTARILTSENVKFFVGLFNSKLFNYIFSAFYAGGGLGSEGIRYKSEFMNSVPIPTLDTPEKQEIAFEIEYFVDQILELKSENANADIADQENKIDDLVFELYGLSEEEIKLVKN